MSLNKLVSILNHRVKGDILVSEMLQVRRISQSVVLLCMSVFFVLDSFF